MARLQARTYLSRVQPGSGCGERRSSYLLNRLRAGPSFHLASDLLHNLRNHLRLCVCDCPDLGPRHAGRNACQAWRSLMVICNKKVREQPRLTVLTYSKWRILRTSGSLPRWKPKATAQHSQTPQTRTKHRPEASHSTILAQKRSASPSICMILSCYSITRHVYKP